ncbi:MAG: NAD(P)/FAD-dependent oxidoreductase, partial [Pyrinomonadaceae bacterium]
DHDCGYEPRGYIFLATDDLQFSFLKQGVEKQRSLGYTGVGIIDRRTVEKMVPGLNCSDMLGGSFGPRDGFIDPLAVLAGFSSRAVERGAKIETRREVSAIVVDDGKLRAIETDDGLVEADKVVLCAGAWARPLAKTAGIDLPVEPLKRQIVWSRCKRQLPANLPMVIDLTDGFHFRPAKNSDHEVLFAFPDKTEVPGHATEFDEAFIDKVYEKARHRAPFLCESEVVRDKCRAGLYENSPDHHAILGGCEIDGLYFANGFSGHGVMHSPATGRALAEIILDGKASFLDVSCLGLDRFEKGDLLHETAFI